MAALPARQAVHQISMNSNEIYHALREDILTLKLHPGQKISENEIAALYNVSRTPVKNAFVRLQSEGFIEILSQRGTYVTYIDAKHIRDIIYMRYVLEMDMCKVALRTHNFGTLIDSLEANLKEQEQIIATPSLNPYTFYVVDSGFHQLLFAHANRGHIWEAIQANQVYYKRFRLLDTTATARYNQLFTDHCNILEALKARDESAVDKFIFHHLHCNLTRIEKVADKYSDYLVNV